MGRVPALRCGLNCSQATLGGTTSSCMCVELSSVAFARGPSVKEPSACRGAAPALGAGASTCSASAQKYKRLHWKCGRCNTEILCCSAISYRVSVPVYKPGAGLVPPPALRVTNALRDHGPIAGNVPGVKKSSHHPRQ